MPHDPHHPDVEEPDDRSEHEIRDRQMIELLNELRVALPGVQILFAFLLTVPFAQGYERITAFQKDVYYWTLIATALSTACLIAPTAAHRLEQRNTRRIIDTNPTLASEANCPTAFTSGSHSSSSNHPTRNFCCSIPDSRATKRCAS
jgi:hypothetical protein